MISPVAQVMIAACILFPSIAYADIVVTVSDGSWMAASTWSTGTVPAEGAEVAVNHAVTIPSGASAYISTISVTGHLSLEAGASLQLPANSAGFIFTVSGILECADGSVLSGTTTSNTRFDGGSRYIHKQGPLGFIPMATWDVESTLQISGFINDGYINLAHSDSWRQSFGNVEYNCPMQTVFVVDLNGHLRDIQGDLIIRNTNNKTLRLCTTQVVTINIGGDFLIEGQSQVWLATNSPNCTVNVGGDFEYRSQATAASYLATRGSTSLFIRGRWIVDARSSLRTASSTADSVGSRLARISVGGDLMFNGGGLVAPPPGSGRATITFDGAARQQAIISSGVSMVGNLEYVVAPQSSVSLGESILVSDLGSVNIQGTLEVGSTDPQGALRTGSDGGNIRVPGTRTFSPESSVIYNGTGAQVMGNGHPSTSSTIVDNAAGVTLVNDVLVKGDLQVVKGQINTSMHSITVEGDVMFSEPASRLGHLILHGSVSQNVDAHGISIQRLEIDKPGGEVRLKSASSIKDELRIISAGTVLRSDGNLTLLSSGDDAGNTALVASIPSGSSIEGVVIVQRFIAGEGRMYRYISSPVTNATVASLMDDFPVTGHFEDPSVGPGIQSTSPSLFVYDESKGEQMAGWRAYPDTGIASNAALVPGVGYAAFVRNQTSTVLDFAGPLNQGSIVVPIGYTQHQGRGNGWYLAGNPYASSIDWDSPALLKASLSNVIAIRDNGDRRFRYWDGDDLYDDIPQGTIASAQSFWVRAIGPGASLTFQEGCKTADANFYRRRSVSVPSLMISISNGKLSDRVLLKLRRYALDTLDGWDGVKLMNDSLNLSIVEPEGNRLAIDCRPKLPALIQLHLADVTPGKYVLRLMAQDTLSALRGVLYDRYLGRSVVVHPSDSVSFEISYDTASSRHDRFALCLEDCKPPNRAFDSLRWSAIKGKPKPRAALQDLNIPERYLGFSHSLPLLNNWINLQEWVNVHAVITDSTRLMERAESPPGILELYPNPVARELTVQGNFMVRSNEACGVELYNAAGIRVSSSEYNVFASGQVIAAPAVLSAPTKSRLMIDVSLLASGEYLLEIRNGDRVKMLRFTKM